MDSLTNSKTSSSTNTSDFDYCLQNFNDQYLNILKESQNGSEYSDGTDHLMELQKYLKDKLDEVTRKITINTLTSPPPNLSMGSSALAENSEIIQKVLSLQFCFYLSFVLCVGTCLFFTKKVSASSRCTFICSHCIIFFSCFISSTST
jgi:hypothetical protein